MRRILSLVVAASMLGLPGSSAAATKTTAVVEPAPSVAELQAMHGQAQQQIELYNATRYVNHLAEARRLLTGWLVAHREVYGDTPEAKQVRAPIEQQLGALDAELTRVGMAAPVIVPAPASPPMTADQAADLRSARTLTGSGTVMLVLGGLTLLGASLPLWRLRDVALRRADEQQFYVDEQRLVARARRRHAGAVTTLAVGSVLAAAGVGLVIVGGVKRTRVRRELTLAPELGRGFAGASATLRF